MHREPLARCVVEIQTRGFTEVKEGACAVRNSTMIFGQTILAAAVHVESESSASATADDVTQESRNDPEQADTEIGAHALSSEPSPPRTHPKRHLSGCPSGTHEPASARNQEGTRASRSPRASIASTSRCIALHPRRSQDSYQRQSQRTA
jgi:hypothetical protein